MDTEPDRPGNAMQRKATSFARFVSEHFFLIIALLFAAWVLRGVPQVYHVWKPRSVVGGSGVAYLSLLTLLAYLYITSAIKFVKPELRIGWLLVPAGFINGWLGYVNRKLIQHLAQHFFYLFCLLLALVGIWLLTNYSLASSTWPYLLFGGFAQMAGVWLIAAAIWMVVGYRQTQKQPDQTLRGFHAIWPSIGRVLSWIAILGFLVELFWASAAGEWPMASYRLYTISSVIHFAMYCVAFAALADLIQTHSILPARWLILPIMLVLFLTSGSSTINDPPPVSPTASAESDKTATDEGHTSDWLDALDKRIDNIPPGPLVLVAASGGGSRAALFTSLILQMMAREPFPDLPEIAPTSQPGSTPRSPPGTWADHIAIISSVSGGSLASARFAFGDYNPAATVDNLKYTTQSELIHEAGASLLNMRNEAQAYNNAGGCESKVTHADQLTAVVRQADCDMKNLLAAMDSIGEPSAATQHADVQSLVNAAFSSRLADEMSMDFMAPVLRGFVSPSASRGDGLYHFWNHQFNWRNISQYSEQANADQPLLLLNASDADTGQRVVAGFPPLNAGFLPGAIGQSKLGLENTSSEFMPVALSDFSTRPIDLSLARAVRVSSNFPFGFNVIELSDSSQPALVPADDSAKFRKLRLMDGGVVDNTGIDSLHAVFKSLDVHAKRNPEGREAVLLNRIRGRGVIIVEIDSGAKPKRHGQGSGASFLSLPINGLSNASYTNSLRNVARFQSELEDLLTFEHNDSLAASLFQADEIYTTPVRTSLTGQQLSAAVATLTPSIDPVANAADIMHFKFTCSKIEQENSAVMTAFALGPRDKAIVTNMFLIETLNWRREVERASDHYRNSVDRFDDIRHSDAMQATYLQQLLQIADQELQALPLRQIMLASSALPSDEKAKLERISAHRAAIPLMAAQTLLNPVEYNTRIGINTPAAADLPNARSTESASISTPQSADNDTANREAVAKAETTASAAPGAPVSETGAHAEVTFTEMRSMEEMATKLDREIRQMRRAGSDALQEQLRLPKKSVELKSRANTWQDLILNKSRVAN